MRKRTLGTQGLTVSEQGLGCMGMSFAYAGQDDDYLRKAVDGSLYRLGIDHIDLYYQHRGGSAVSLNSEDLAEIDAVSPIGIAAGERYDEEGMRTVDV